jgi:Arm DNA-binding domain
MRQKISKSAVDALQPGQNLADSNPIGFVARRLPSGAITYGYRYRDKETGQQRWIGLGLRGDITPDQARRKAFKIAAQVKDGGQPVSAAARPPSEGRRSVIQSTACWTTSSPATFNRSFAAPMRWNGHSTSM